LSDPDIAEVAQHGCLLFQTRRCHQLFWQSIQVFFRLLRDVVQNIESTNRLQFIAQIMQHEINEPVRLIARVVRLPF
jgi:hypothetical protein